MIELAPKVSIGLPVYNGENYLREAVDSVLAQTLTDWELIISDNCSTDATASIAKDYAARDSRIRYHRNLENIGATGNHNQTVKMARGKYFRFYAHDDVILPQYLEKCVAVLEQNPEIVSCHSKTMIMDKTGKDIKPDPWHLRTDSPNPLIRFHDIVWVHHHVFLIYGLIRRELLLQTPVFGPFSSSDQVLMAELSLYGRFHTVPELLSRSRRHSAQSVALTDEYLKGKQVRSKWLTRAGVPPHSFNQPKAKWKLSFHMWRVVREYSAAPWRTPASLSTKLACTANIAAYAVMNAHKLTRDLVIAVYQTWRWMEHRSSLRKAPSTPEALHEKIEKHEVQA